MKQYSEARMYELLAISYKYYLHEYNLGRTNLWPTLVRLRKEVVTAKTQLEDRFNKEAEEIFDLKA